MHLASPPPHQVRLLGLFFVHFQQESSATLWAQKTESVVTFRKPRRPHGLGVFAFHSRIICSALSTLKGFNMFWPFLAFTIVGAGAVKLGAMSVMLSVLTLALEALVIANLIGGGIYLWRRFRNNP
jgi:hypothetical protein